MVMFDANMILRYLLNDNEQMAEKAEQYLDAGNVWVTIEVIAEVVYVLKGVYSL
jgi:Predicted nucleic-acid-binding protein, contains PIN domain